MSLETAALPLQQAEPTRFLGKQPILDLNSKLYGYELLFRAGEANVFSGDPEAATHQVIDNYLLLSPAQNEWQAFVNCTRQTLVSGVVNLLPPQASILEILENIEPDEEVLSCCRALQKQGYRFALDDFSPHESKRPFLEFADVIKIDFRASGPAERQAIYALARERGSRLLAEKVETEKEVATARAEGCTLFQGYFFSRPVIVSRSAVPGSYVVYLKVLAALSQASPKTREIEQLILSDPTLCYRLLRIVNSAMCGLSTHVTSIRTALMLVGNESMCRLVTIGMAGLAGDKQPKVLGLLALERGRFCELLAPLLGKDPAEWYLLGMLSLIDVIMQTPMAKVLEFLPLAPEVKQALCGGTGDAASALDFLRCYEAGNWDACESSLQRLQLTERQITALYVAACRWAAIALPT